MPDELSELRYRNAQLEGGLRKVLNAFEAGVTPAQGVITDLRVLVEAPYAKPEKAALWEQSFPPPIPDQPLTPRIVNVDLNQLERPCCHDK